MSSVCCSYGWCILFSFPPVYTHWNFQVWINRGCQYSVRYFTLLYFLSICSITPDNRFGNYCNKSAYCCLLLVFPITFCTGFMLAKYVTFTTSELHGRVQLFRYWVIVVASVFLNYLFLKFFVEYMEMEAVVAKIFTTIFVVCFSYISQRHFSFKTAKYCKPIAVTETEKIWRLE